MNNDSICRTRRRVLQMLAAAAVSGRAFAAQNNGPEFAALDHVEFYVSDAEKSRDFFLRVFGATLRMRGAKRYLKLGSAYMAFEPPRGTFTAGSLDHFSASIRSLDMPRLHSALDERGIRYQDYPSGRDTGITDPDGIRMQLSPEDGWSLLNPANFPPETTAFADEPIFLPNGLEHVLLNVTDVGRSAAFYEKLLGRPSRSDGNRVWFQAGASRIGLQPAAAGQRAGVNRLCVNAARFDYDACTRRLQQIGAAWEPSEISGAPQLRDPDGLRIQVKG
jgi:catechol 2,3-dioxygenase-like lactoylglutathione lyase family enzyme